MLNDWTSLIYGDGSSLFDPNFGVKSATGTPTLISDPTKTSDQAHNSNVLPFFNNLINAAGSAYGASQRAGSSPSPAVASAQAAAAGSFSKVALIVVGGIVALVSIIGLILAFRRRGR